MVDKPYTRRRRNGELVTRRGLSLPPTDDARLQELADRHYGGNVSLLVRKLLERAWQAEDARAESEQSELIALAS